MIEISNFFVTKEIRWQLVWNLCFKPYFSMFRAPKYSRGPVLGKHWSKRTLWNRFLALRLIAGNNPCFIRAAYFYHKTTFYSFNGDTYVYLKSNILECIHLVFILLAQTRKSLFNWPLKLSKIWLNRILKGYCNNRSLILLLSVNLSLSTNQSDARKLMVTTAVPL